MPRSPLRFEEHFEERVGKMAAGLGLSALKVEDVALCYQIILLEDVRYFLKELVEIKRHEVE